MKHQIGKTRYKLAKMLKVRPEDIWEQNHNIYFSAGARWGVENYSSFDTMADCVKFGFDIIDVDGVLKDVVARDISL